MKVALLAFLQHPEAVEKYKDRKVIIYSGYRCAYWSKKQDTYTTKKSEALILTLSQALISSSHCSPENKIEFHFIDILGENHLIQDIKEGELEDFYNNPYVKFDKYNNAK